MFDEGCPLAADELELPHAKEFDGPYVTGIYSILHVAVRNGAITLLEMLVERGCVLKTQTEHQLCTMVARGGHLTCFKCLRARVRLGRAHVDSGLLAGFGSALSPRVVDVNRPIIATGGRTIPRWNRRTEDAPRQENC